MNFRVHRRTPDAPSESASGRSTGRREEPTPAPHGEPKLRPVPTPVAPVIVPRWVQMVMLPIALLGLWELARAAGNVLLILIVASLIALILAPVVRLLSRHMPRGLAIFAVYLSVLAVLVAIGFVLAGLVSDQVTNFQRNLPSIIAGANRDLADVQRWLDQHGIHIHLKHQGQSALDTLQRQLAARSSTIVSFSRDLLSGIVTVGFDLILILVLSIYLLLYGEQIGALARSIMPSGDGTPEDDYPHLVQQAVSGYVRGQLSFSLIMGASAAVVLTISGIVGIFPDGERYAVFLGAFYGLMEFIPYIGPIIGPAPAVALALFQNPISAVWVVLLFIGLQQLEGHVVAPQVFRISLRINPILIILALLIGYQLYGIVGSLIALPSLAVIRQTVLYLRRHLVFEPWGVVGAGSGLGLLDSGQGRCSECGTQADPGDTLCRSCGASLQPRVPSPQ